MSRPISVTLTIWLVLILSIWNLIKVWTSLAWRDVLLEFSISVKPEIITVISIIWALTGFILLWGILQKKAWSKKVLAGTALSYTVWFWSERFIWQNPKTNNVFTVLINLVILTIIYFATREAYERPNQTTE